MFNGGFHHLGSVLYVPADRPRALDKLNTLACGAAIIDLEDAVAPAAKNEARQIAAAFLAGPRPAFPLVLRLNAASTDWGNQDRAMLENLAADARPDAVLLPKVESAADIEQAAATGLPLWAMIESPRALLALPSIAAAAPGQLAAFVVGTNDLAKDTGTSMGEERRFMLPWLMGIIAAARAFDLACYDGVFNSLEADAAFEAECAQGRAMGFDGKTLVHPAQIDAANRAFAPTLDEIAHAKAIIEAFSRPENAERGAIRLGTQMVERLHLAAAERLLNRLKV
ncbi:MAG: CoA ester lyase [Phyllobacteriaceae bacterium]|nr:CoA ester lyase [Phyllobacteriaceae bacterium]